MIVSSYDLFFLNCTSVCVYSFNCNWPWSCLEAGPCFTFIFLYRLKWLDSLALSVNSAGAPLCNPLFLSFCPLFILPPFFHVIHPSIYFSSHSSSLSMGRQWQTFMCEKIFTEVKSLDQVYFFLLNDRKTWEWCTNSYWCSIFSCTCYFILNNLMHCFLL